ncbi:mRNA capping enzyme-domain-containing protein [Abortiporus biennis]|nr:mRNA capping enzyme-domain-containing protein [Abortiporus biennis]
MPAFDPVRDAVLNSPHTQVRNLPSRIHIDTPNITNPSPTSTSDSARSAPSPIPRRATDLSMLLNSDPPPTPLFTPTTPRPPTNLSHLLHPDDSPLQQHQNLEDQLAHAAPLRRKSDSFSSPDYPRPTSASNSYFPSTPQRSSPISSLVFPAHQEGNSSTIIPPSSSVLTRSPPAPLTLQNSSPSHFSIPASPSPTPRPSTSGSSASRPSASPPMSKRVVPPRRAASPSEMPPPPIPSPRIQTNQQQQPQSVQPEPRKASMETLPPRPLSSSSTNKPVPVSKPPPPTPAPAPKRSMIPYAPSHRISAPGSVLIPLSPAELEWYKNYPGGVGSQMLKSKKRKRTGDDEGGIFRFDGKDEDERPHKRTKDVASIVNHYNARPEVGVIQRNDSPIIGLKNFNNWVKSVLITQFAHPILAKSPNAGPYPNSSGMRPGMQIRPGGNRGAGKVLDLGCGKGGDLTKWAKAKIREYVGVDIAAVSVDQARDRYNSLRGPKFAASFGAADCYAKPLNLSLPPSMVQSILPPNGAEFDVVTMQFCMHYAFESEEKARFMLHNVSKWLRTGGVFVGTIPNAALLLEQLDALPEDATDLSFGNSVYKIRFENRKDRPVYGDRYFFYLKDAVDDVPEYVVHWDHFVQLASEYSLYPTYVKSFHEVFEENSDHAEFGPLLERMKVVDGNGESQMDEDQWEAANIYIAFAFEKH